jgi:ligand-binding sensor domain-containing protein
MSVRDFILGISGILVLVTLGMVVMMKRDLNHSQKSYSPLVQKIQADSIAIHHLGNKIDSLKLADKTLAKTIVYLDSCNQNRTNKADRAEKRGRFVGGLLKSLFPGL